MEVCVIAAPVTVNVLNAVVAPTAPVIVTAPPVPPVNVNVRPAAFPLIVLEKLMFPPVGFAPPFVVSKVMFAPRDTTPVNEIGAPLVVILALKVMVPALPEPAVKESETPLLFINTAFVTVIELPAAFCAQSATFVAEAAIVAGAID